MSDQGDFFPKRPRFGGKHEAAFWEFHGGHPEVFRKLLEMADKMRRRGRKRYSMRTLWEVLRWHSDSGDPEAEFKLNDHCVPYYSRLLMHRHPRFQGLFELREMH